MSLLIERSTPQPAAGGPPRYGYLPHASDRDLIGAYCFGHGLVGAGAEPCLTRAVGAWLTAAEAELERRGLLKEAKRAKSGMYRDYHAREGGDKKARAS